MITGVKRALGNSMSLTRSSAVKDRASSSARAYQGSNKLIFGIVLAVVTFWLFAQTTLNIASTMRADLRISESLNNISVSITALFSGIFIVVAGDLADRIGRVKMTYLGLAFSILGSLLIAVSPAGTAVFLMAGRIIQGLSAACIMPATLALLKAYFDGAARQRAISFWSIGSWGGSGLCSLFGGLVASSFGWRWIFWMSIVVAVGSFLLIRGTPESKQPSTGKECFDWLGLIAFIIAMVALNVVIGQGASLGWTSPAVLMLIGAFVLAALIFFRTELSVANSFADLTLFKDKTFAGATLSNFLLNGAAGTLIVALALVQQAAGLSTLQSGLLTLGYLVAILSTIRVGEKLLQRMGARKPMLYGCLITAIGISLTCCTFLLAEAYLVIAFIGFTLFGIGLGFYATPSTDAALSNVPQAKAGSASGLYKMASSLGAALGVAISAAVFSALSSSTSRAPLSDLFLGRTDNITIRFGAAVGLLFNVALAIIAAVAVAITVPNDDPRKAKS
jgi:DHA2 family multidrug resistance protein-like MFS transporter